MTLTEILLTEHQLTTYKEIFCRFDKNGNGSISPSEFYEIIRELDHVFQESQVRDIFNKIDIDKNNQISYEDFLDSISLIRQLQLSQKNDLTYDEATELFKLIDKDNDGTISASDLGDIFEKRLENPTYAQYQVIGEIIINADIEYNAQIKQTEFVTAIRNWIEYETKTLHNSTQLKKRSIKRKFNQIKD